MILVLGLAFAALGIAVQVVLYILDARGKRLSVEVVAYWRPSDDAFLYEMRRANTRPLMQDQGGGIAIFLLVNTLLVHLARRNGRRKPVIFPETTVLKAVIANRGNASIQRSDFESPLRVEVLEGRLSSAKVAGSRFPALQPRIRQRENAVVVAPLLLNPGDWFSIEMQVEELEHWTIFDRVVSGSARIVGVRRVVTSRMKRRQRGAAYSSLVLVIGACWVIVVARWPHWHWLHGVWGQVGGFALGMLLSWVFFEVGTRSVDRGLKVGEFTTPGDLVPHHEYLVFHHLAGWPNKESLTKTIERRAAGGSDDESPGFLGVITSIKESKEQSVGAVVLEVVEGSPAARAGLNAGDAVLAVDGTAVTCHSELISIVGSRSAGDSIVLTVEQGGVAKDLDVELAEPAKQ
jgi:hypothetical protein